MEKCSALGRRDVSCRICRRARAGAIRLISTLYPGKKAGKEPYDAHPMPCRQAEREYSCPTIKPFDPSDGVQRQREPGGPFVERDEA